MKRRVFLKSFLGIFAAPFVVKAEDKPKEDEVVGNTVGTNNSSKDMVTWSCRIDMSNLDNGKIVKSVTYG